MTLGEKLRRARTEAGLSQKQLCAGRITRNQLSQLEHDRAAPSLDTLRYLAQRLGRPVSWFLEETATREALLERAEGAEGEEFLALARALLTQEAAALAVLARLFHEEGAPEKAACLLSCLPDPALRGQALYRMGCYEAALEALREAEDRASPAEKKQLRRLLEYCCRDMGDFRMAYYYASLDRAEDA